MLRGRYAASDLSGLGTVTTPNGSNPQVGTDDGVWVEEATLARADG